ncbi:MAG: hypothetical protein ACKVUS_05800 [Saprospiraceae bacterium]
MKNNIILTLAFLGMAVSACTQNINWQAFKPEQKHIAHFQTGWDYGLTFGLGYGLKFNTKMPVLANIEYSAPVGGKPLDDFKVRMGGQIELLRWSGLSLTAKAYCPFRRFENNQVRLLNFGGEVSGVVGFYRRRWFLAGEFGFDKAIVTHIRHSRSAQENYPGIQDGWYLPTGGNYFYGLQTGFSFRANELSLKAGKLATQGWDTAPFIPLFAQLTYQRRF